MKSNFVLFLLVCVVGDDLLSESPRKKLKGATSERKRKSGVSFEEDEEVGTDSETIGDLLTPRSEDTSIGASSAFYSFDGDNNGISAYEEDVSSPVNKQDPPSSIMERKQDIDVLTHKMKSVSVKKKPSKLTSFLTVQHPSMLTTFQDAEKRNNMLNLEVHLSSCTIQDDIEPSLEVRADGYQYLVLKEKMSMDFIYPAFFKEFLPDTMSADDKSSLFLRRKDQLIAMQSKYCGDNSKDDEDENIFMTSSYKLPFICDDVFNIPEADRYPGTMSDFQWWSVCDDPDTVNDKVDESVNIQENNQLGFVEAPQAQEDVANAVDKMKVFVVRLVAKEKLKERMTKPPPKNHTINKLVLRRARN